MDIFYKNTLYEKNEFLEIIKKECKENFSKSNLQEMYWKDFILPHDFEKFNMKNWIEYSGAYLFD